MNFNHKVSINVLKTNVYIIQLKGTKWLANVIQYK